MFVIILGGRKADSFVSMTSFDHRMASAVNDPGKQGWLVAILELGAWFGVLVTGMKEPILSLSPWN